MFDRLSLLFFRLSCVFDGIFFINVCHTIQSAPKSAPVTSISIPTLRNGVVPHPMVRIHSISSLQSHCPWHGYCQCYHTACQLISIFCHSAQQRHCKILKLIKNREESRFSTKKSPYFNICSALCRCYQRHLPPRGSSAVCTSYTRHCDTVSHYWHVTMSQYHISRLTPTPPTVTTDFSFTGALSLVSLSLAV